MGNRPAWLDEEEPSELFSVKEARQKIERINPGQLRKVVAQEFVDVSTQGNAIKLGVRGFVRICIETCARGYFGA